MISQVYLNSEVPLLIRDLLNFKANDFTLLQDHSVITSMQCQQGGYFDPQQELSTSETIATDSESRHLNDTYYLPGTGTALAFPLDTTNSSGSGYVATTGAGGVPSQDPAATVRGHSKSNKF